MFVKIYTYFASFPNINISSAIRVFKHEVDIIVIVSCAHGLYLYVLV
jgi:hypothetical protein